MPSGAAVTRERFEQGMTLQQYIDRMSVNQDRLVRAIDAVTITSDDREVLRKLGETLKVLVLTEDWCGTSLAYLPFVAKLVDGNPNVEMRIFLRDENPDLMDQFLKRGLHRSIPVFAFFDAEMHEVARFIEARPV